jgi:hypothetical protein
MIFLEIKRAFSDTALCPNGLPYLQLLYRTLVLDDSNPFQPKRGDKSFPSEYTFFKVAHAFFYIVADPYEATVEGKLPELNFSIGNQN